MAQPTSPSPSPGVSPDRPSPFAGLRVAPWTTGTTALLAVALGVLCVSVAVVVDVVDGSALGAGIAAGFGVAGVVVAGGLWETRLRSRRREVLADALELHATSGGAAPEDPEDDPVLRVAVSLVARAEQARARRDGEHEVALDRLRDENRLLRHQHVSVLRALRQQVSASLADLRDHDDPSLVAVVDAVTTVAVDAVDVELGDLGDLSLDRAPVTVEALLVGALDPVARVVGPDVAVEIDGELADLERAAEVDLPRLSRTLRTIAWGAAAGGADAFVAAIEVDRAPTDGAGDVARIRLAPVDTAALGDLTLEAARGMLVAHGGGLDVETGAVVASLPVLAWHPPADVPTDPSEEAAPLQLVDHVDEDDEVLEVVTRAEMRARGLRHRAVYVVVRTSDDGIVVHRRADWKDVYPGAWDICFGGVLDAGEGWADAAARELAEEAGIEAELTEVRRATWAGEGTAIVGRVFECTHDGPYPCPDGEVVEVRVVPRRELGAFLAEHDHCPDSAAIAIPAVDA